MYAQRGNGTVNNRRILKRKLKPGEKVNRTYYGLYYKTPEGNPAPLPLRSIDVVVKIRESIARVEYTQVFENNTNYTLDVQYIFPISTSGCFDSFSAKYKSSTIEGEIAKKGIARTKFKTAKKEGKTAIYAEISEESNDLMLVKIGNMEPSTSITINLSYIEQLDTSANKLWKYTVLGSLKPRYNPPSNPAPEKIQTEEEAKEGEKEGEEDDSKAISILNYPYITSKNPNAYKWKILVEIESNSKVNFVECPTYKIQTEYEDMVKAVVKLDPSEDFLPTRDFTIYFSTEGINKPNYMLTQYDEGYCAMINYVPQTNYKSMGDAYQAQLQDEGFNIPDIEFETVKGEFIFLLDRSGSMSGFAIKMAREALVIFLKSLPKDAYFNIVSFGGIYELYSKDGSLLATQENVQKAVEEVLTYEGTMGGTEILAPLETIYDMKQQPDTRRKIFLLTDGEVHNMKAIFQSIEQHASQARLFSVGIGKSASRELIIQSARAGKGCYEFVDDVNKIGERVISLLTLSMQICAHSYQLKFPLGFAPNMVIPHPNTVGPTYEGKYLTFFVFFGKEELEKKESVLVDLFYKRDEKQEGSNQGLEIKVKDSLTDAHPLNHAIWKLGFHQMFSIFEREKPKSTDSIVYFGDQALTRHDVEPLSVKYGVLCEKTAFVCVFKDENNQITSTEQIEVVVPSILAADKPDDAKKAKKSKTATRRRMKGKNMATRSRSRSRSKSPVRTKAKMKAKKRAVERSPDRGTLGEGQIKAKLLNALSRGVYSSGVEEAITFDEADDHSGSEQSDTDLLESFDGIKIQTNQRESKESAYNRLFAIINKQDSTGKWDYSLDLVILLEIQDKSWKNNIPEKVQQHMESEALMMTAAVLTGLKAKFNEFKSVWHLVYRKGSEYIKSRGFDLKDFAFLNASF